MKRFFVFAIVAIFSAFFPVTTHAQMMWQGGNNQSTQGATLSQEDKEDIQEGQKLYNQLKNNQISCTSLKDSDFDKIGEYVMEQQIGNPDRHAQLNQQLTNMMGQAGEENMHVLLGRRATGCTTGLTTWGGGMPMMGWNYAGMGGYGFGLWSVGAFLIWLATLTVLVLLGVWLFKQIRRSK